jgi:RNA polymerase sigma factor (sigma-70 family)
MPMNPNPLTDEAEHDVDQGLVERAQSGSREALEQLITRHQRWIFNIVLRMLYLPQDAEDVTQEILIKLITKLSTYRGESRFRTWLYRIVVNHVLNMNRTRGEAMEWTFEKYGSGLSAAPDEELPDQRSVPVDLKLIVDEAMIGCTSGMLLCLSREQRLVYILGEIFGVTDVVGAELLAIGRDSFRQKLSRARRDLHQFMHGQCGLVNAANPCRCAKKTQAFIRAGYIDTNKLLFASEHVTRVRDVAEKAHETLEALDQAYAEIHRGHPFLEGCDFVAQLRDLMQQPDFKQTLDVD